MMTAFFDRLSQLGVTEAPLRTHAQGPDVGAFFRSLGTIPEDALMQPDRLFRVAPGFTNMDASTLGSPLRGIGEDDEPLCSTFSGLRANLAKSFGCETDEIAVTSSTTDAIAKILLGLDLARGDEVVLTDHEHFGSLAPLAVLRDRIGIRLKVVELPEGHAQTPQDILARFEEAISSETKLVVFSGVTATLGTRLPVRQVARLAQRHGAVTLLDAAHLPGMLDVSFHECGVDFAAGSGNKWQCGPPGTGIVYIRNRVLAEHNPNPLPVFWPAASIWYPPEGGLPARSTGREPSYDVAEYVQNAGAASVARLRALEFACAVFDRIGRQRIEQRILGLSAALRAQICEELGADHLFSPDGHAALHSGLVAFNPYADPGAVLEPGRMDRFAGRMEHAHGLIVKRIDFPWRGRTASAIRVAVRLWHDDAVFGRFFEASRKAAGG